LRAFIQSGKRNAQTRSLLPRTVRAGYAADLQPILHLLSEHLNEIRRRRSRPQPNHLTILHEPQAGPRRRLFFLIVCHKFSMLKVLIWGQPPRMCNRAKLDSTTTNRALQTRALTEA